MYLYFQWSKWAYSNIASNKVIKIIKKSWVIVKWLDSFNCVWEKIKNWNINKLWSYISLITITTIYFILKIS